MEQHDVCYNFYTVSQETSIYISINNFTRKKCSEMPMHRSNVGCANMLPGMPGGGMLTFKTGSLLPVYSSGLLFHPPQFLCYCIVLVVNKACKRMHDNGQCRWRQQNHWCGKQALDFPLQAVFVGTGAARLSRFTLHWCRIDWTLSASNRSAETDDD